MKTPAFLRPIKRRSEDPELYADPLEAEAYLRESGSGLVQWVERRFAASLVQETTDEPALRVLDVGSGPGWIPMIVARARPDWEITAVDASASMLISARSEARSRDLQIRWVRSVAEQEPFPDGYFDLVVSHFAFSEFSNPAEVLGELKRVLKGGGRLIIQDLVRPPRWQFPLLILCRYLTMPFNRMSRQYVDSLRGAYTPSEMARYLQAAGLASDVGVFMRWGGGLWRVESREKAYRNLLENEEYPAPDRRRVRKPASSVASNQPSEMQLDAAEAPGEPPATLQPTHETVSRVVEAARWAPTPDNWQPWRFHWTGECIELFWDFEVGTSFLDVDHCVAFLSVGGAVTNMEIVAGEEGYGLVVDLSSECRSDCPAARIFFKPAARRSSSLAAMIPERCTNRRPYRREPLESSLIECLRILGNHGSKARFTLLAERHEIEKMGSLAGDFDQFFLQHREIHDVIFRWIRWTEDEVLQTRDGLPLSSLELSNSDRFGMYLIRKWDRAKVIGSLGMRRRLAKRAGDLYTSSGAFGVVALSEPTAEAAFEAGQIVEKIWLVSTERNLAFQPIAGPPLLIMRNRLKDGVGLTDRQRDWALRVERDLRSLCHLEEGDLPALLFRVGEAAPPSARALRRPLSSLFS